MYLEPDKSVFDDVDSPHAVLPAELVEKNEHAQRICHFFAAIVKVDNTHWEPWIITKCNSLFKKDRKCQMIE